MDDKKKKFVIPDAEVIDFAMEDIVTISAAEQKGMTNGLWGDDDNTESW